MLRTNGCGAGGCGAGGCGASNFNKFGCGTNRNAVGECGVVRCVGNCFDFAAMSWRSRSIICLSNMFLGRVVCFIYGMKALSSPSLVSRMWIAWIRLISMVIIKSAERFSAAADWALHRGMRAKICAKR